MTNELVEGKRVRLMRDTQSVAAGATGYLHESRPGGAWGVVFDAEAGYDMLTTHISDETPDGGRVKLLDVVEVINDEDESAADGRAEMETLAAWPLDDAPSCPSCGGVETMPAYFGSEFGWRQCRACENLFTRELAS